MELLKQLFIPVCVLWAGITAAVAQRDWRIAVIAVVFSLSYGIVVTLLEKAQEKKQQAREAEAQVIVDKLVPKFNLINLPYDSLGEFKELLTKKDEIREVIQTLSNNSILQPEQLISQVETLLETYYNLVLASKKIEPFTASGIIRELDVEIENLEESLQACDDEIMKQNFQMALANKKGEKEKVVEFQQDKKRISAQLTNIATAVENIYVRLVHFSLTPQDFDHVSQKQITDQIDDLIRGLQVSEKIAREVNLTVNERKLKVV
jgi:hypothetical protein